MAVAPEFMPRVRRDESMSRHTSWHVGGPAEIFFNPRDRMDLAAFLRSLPGEVPIHWIGLGSNVLVRDGGLSGVVIATYGALERLDRVSQTTIFAEAGVACARIAKQCIRWGLGPAEFLAGIPGTLGGALAMNAGAFGGEIWQHVVEVQTIDRRGVEHLRAASEFQVGPHRMRGFSPRACTSRKSPPRMMPMCVRFSHGARPRSRSAPGAAARYLPIRPATMRRASSRLRVLRAIASAMRRCRRSTPISSSTMAPLQRRTSSS